jgi:hypothetical protein
MGVFVGFGVCVGCKVGVWVAVGPVVSVGCRVGVWVAVGWFMVGEAGDVGEAREVCWADWVIAARVKATLVARRPFSGVVPPPCGRLQAVRRRMSNAETARREEFGFI